MGTGMVHQNPDAEGHRLGNIVGGKLGVGSWEFGVQSSEFRVKGFEYLIVMGLKLTKPLLHDSRFASLEANSLASILKAQRADLQGNFVPAR